MPTWREGEGFEIDDTQFYVQPEENGEWIPVTNIDDIPFAVYDEVEENEE